MDKLGFKFMQTEGSTAVFSPSFLEDYSTSAPGSLALSHMHDGGPSHLSALPSARLGPQCWKMETG